MKELESCMLCPNNCKVNRLEGKIGSCRAGKDIKIALYSLHKYEEPCISGTNGSGTVFFSNCNMHCKYCQNYKISQEGKGYIITINELADIFINLQNQGAHNINLVTPTPYVPHIKQAIAIAKRNGLKLPIIYNSSGYENIDVIKSLEGFIDVYLPDFKYAENSLALNYSGINNYFEYTAKAINEMQKQVGRIILDENDIIQKGVIIRHLILPGHVENTKKVLNWLKENVNEGTYISIMAQYFPTYKAKNNENLNRKITARELKKVEDYLYGLDLKSGYLQEIESEEENYVPNF